MITVTELLHDEDHERQDLVRGLRTVTSSYRDRRDRVGCSSDRDRDLAAGPGLVLAYAVGGIAIFFIMGVGRESARYRPVAGSFASYAEEFVGPWLGSPGLVVWFMWVVTAWPRPPPSRSTSITRFGHPAWVPALVTLGVLYRSTSSR